MPRTILVKDYHKIPFKYNGRDFDGCDCWGLVHLVYKYELGITLPKYNNVEASTHREVVRAMMTESMGDDWVQVGQPQAFDVVLMKARVQAMDFKRRMLPIHVGVMIDENRFMHTEENVNVVVQRLKDRDILPRIEKIFRFRECL